MRPPLSLTCAATLMVLLTSGPALAADDQRPSVFRKLVTSDAEILSAITACYGQSPTCRRLIDEIEASSTSVYLRRGQCRSSIRRSYLLFSAAQAGERYLQIVLDKDLSGEQLVATAAHELQHAVEVVRAPEVVDLNSFRLLYTRIGYCVRGSGMREDWETTEAQRTASVVSREIRRSQRAEPLATK
jgi:hypothetical protein